MSNPDNKRDPKVDLSAEEWGEGFGIVTDMAIWVARWRARRCSRPMLRLYAQVTGHAFEQFRDELKRRRARDPRPPEHPLN